MRGRGVGPSWACGALPKLLRVCFTPSAPLFGPTHSYISGWDNLEGKNKRTGARVVENAKLRQPVPPRAGPRRRWPLGAAARHVSRDLAGRSFGFRQGKGVPLTTTLLLMVISHKFTNNLILLVHPELLLTTLLTSKPRCQSGPEVGSDHVSSKSR